MTLILCLSIGFTKKQLRYENIWYTSLMQRAICNIFERLTGRAKPSLTHPTSSKFSLEDWENSVLEEKMEANDAYLTVGGMFLGAELKLLREKRLNGIFENLDRISAIRLGVASVNRASSLGRKLQLKQLKKERPPVGHMDAVTRQKIPTIHGETRLDAAMTSIIDSLPNWFFVAKQNSPETGKIKPDAVQDCLLIHRRAEIFITLERTLQDLWNELLWEPWMLNPKPLSISPLNRRDAEKWIAWNMRDEALLLQAMRFDLAMGYGRGHHDLILDKTISKVRRKCRGIRISLSRPNKKKREDHYWRMEMAERSYLGPFLDLKPKGKKFSIRDLLKVWIVLCDFAEFWSSSSGTVEFKTVTDVERVACELPSDRWFSILVEATSFEHEKISEIMAVITADPLATSDTFKSGFWHRPLVKHPTENRLMCLIGVLAHANLIYTMEHWLRDTGMIDNIGKSSLGIKYEDDLRAAIHLALKSNQSIQDFKISEHAIKKKKDDDEEIDFLLRLGNKIIVGEIKCFVRPADPIQRFDYLEKLNAAANQVSRKANWAARQETLFETIFDEKIILDDYEFIPLIILNSGAGLGLEIDGVICTDGRWLKLILENNSYSSGLMVDYQTKEKRPVFTQLYSNQADLESKFVQILKEPTGLQKYLSALVWRDFKVPTSSGREIAVEFCELDNTAMVAAEMGPMA